MTFAKKGHYKVLYSLSIYMCVVDIFVIVETFILSIYDQSLKWDINLLMMSHMSIDFYIFICQFFLFSAVFSRNVYIYHALL